MLISRKFERQGKASAKPDGVVTYGEGDKSMLQHSITRFIQSALLISRNCVRQGKTSEWRDGIVTYVERYESKF